MGAERRFRRPGFGGTAVTFKLRQLDSRSGADGDLFPTVTSGFTGQGKWQLGPTFVAGYLTKQYFIGVFPQQWWSIGGEHGKPDTNQMNLQPIATLFFPDGWSLGYSGNILANWNAPSDDVWTVPIGLGLDKVVKLGRLPVKIQLAVQYMPVHPWILRTGVERAALDHSRYSKAHQGRAFPVTRKDNARVHVLQTMAVLWGKSND